MNQILAEGGWLTGKEMIKLLKSHGWTVARIKGSHHWMVNPEFPGVGFPVPVHSGAELGKGLESKILKLAGLKGVE